MASCIPAGAPWVAPGASLEEAVRGNLVNLLPRLRRFARSLTREDALTDDLVQTAIERALRLRGRCRPDTRIDSLLCKILHNAWRDELRRRGRRQAVAVESHMLVVDGERALLNRVMLRQVNVAMRRLPGTQQRTLRHIGIAGRSYAETATLMGTSMGTVMSRCARARRRLVELAGEADAA